MLRAAANTFMTGETLEINGIQIGVALNTRVHTITDLVETLQIGTANEDICAFDLIFSFFIIKIADSLIVGIIKDLFYRIAF